MIIHWLSRFYAALLYLYPRSFRAEFAEEMSEVFTQAIREASFRSVFALAYLCLNELISLPGSLFMVRRSGVKPNRTISALPLQMAGSTAAPWQELVIALTVFLLPAGVIILIKTSPASGQPGGVTILIFFVVMLCLGWLGGLPLRSLSYYGVIMSIAGYLALFHWVAGLISPVVVSSLSLRPVDRSAELMLLVVSNGMLWMMLFCLTLLIVALLVVFNRFQPLLGRIRHDWTLLSYILYGESVFVLLLLCESQRFERSFTIAAGLCMLTGVWFYLRAASRWQRQLALTTCLTLAVVVAAFGSGSFRSQGGWSFLSANHLTNLGRLAFAWISMLGALTLPGLLARFNIKQKIIDPQR